MTNEEFSNAFDTLINAYKHKAEFGDQSSVADVVVDEYEKSIFLTQAQDNIVKNYFTRGLSPSGEGFDDSTRRQMDFSSLVTISTFASFSAKGAGFNDYGYLIDFDDSDFGSYTADGKTYTKSPLFIINEKISCGGTSPTTSYVEMSAAEKASIQVGNKVYVQSGSSYSEVEVTADNIEALKAETLYKKVTIPGTGDNSAVVIPINYKDYDRMMSRAYSEPLKRQAWRLFEADSNTIKRQAEIILRSDSGTPSVYKVRYVRRPRPIVLVDLTDTANNLSIDGVQEITTCELNPILHQEILQEAVRLALATNGVETPEVRQARQQQSR